MFSARATIAGVFDHVQVAAAAVAVAAFIASPANAGVVLQQPELKKVNNDYTRTVGLLDGPVSSGALWCPFLAVNGLLNDELELDELLSSPSGPPPVLVKPGFEDNDFPKLGSGTIASSGRCIPDGSECESYA